MFRYKLLVFGAALLLGGCAASDVVLGQPELASAPPTELGLVEQVDPELTKAPVPTVPPQPPAVPAALRLAIAGDVILDPLEASPVAPTDMVIVDLLYDALTVWDSDTQSWEPSLASEFVVSGDRMSWTATLSGATFSDGVPVTAGDVKRSLDRFSDGPLSLGGARLELVEQIVAVDFMTVRFELGEPYALLPALLSSPIFGIVPMGELDGSVGSGPLVFEGPGRMRPWDDRGLSFTGVDLVTVESDAGAVELRDSGDVDLAFLSPSFGGPFDVSVASAVEVHYALNTASQALTDLVARRTVLNGVSSGNIVEDVFGDAAVPIDRLSPDTPACSAECDGRAFADPPIADLGELAIVYVADPAGSEKSLADALVGQLLASGIESAATGYELDEFVQVVASGDYDLVRTGWIALSPSADSQLSPYLSDSPDNVSAYSDEAFDRLLRTARGSGLPASYDEVAAYLADGAAVLPIARLQLRMIVGETVEGLEFRHDGTFDVASLVVTEPAG